MITCVLLGWLPTGIVVALCLSTLAVTPWVQAVGHYQLSLITWPLTQWPADNWLAVMLRQGLLIGWFPALPWLAVSGYGVLAGRWYRADRLGWLKLLGGLLVAAGMVCWGLNPPPMWTRQHYSELFYPPTPAFLLSVVGVITLALSLQPQSGQALAGTGWVRLLGRHALLVYGSHAFLIEGFDRLTHRSHQWPMGQYLLVYVALMLILLGLCQIKETMALRRAQAWLFSCAFLMVAMVSTSRVMSS